ncbi:MAG: hypothetical protein II997_05405 [Clostridia bacterium]|nr:hypothetical protein [Clostridia bacterium]
MISCTEFIPLYSEFFKFLEAKGGREAVLEYWYHVSDKGLGDKTNPNSLISFVERDGGLEGAVHYFDHTLAEEACDVLRITDLKNGYYYECMRHCPSRGMLNALEHVEPYHNYCEHCDVIYARVLNQYGLEFEMDLANIDKAACTSLIYAKGNRPENFDAIDDSKIVVDLKPEDNKYLHRDFHLSGDLALQYCGDTFGEEGVLEFLQNYTKHFYSPQIKDIKDRGLIAIKEWIEHNYEVEEASELLHTELTENKLMVTVDYSPVIAYMRSLNQEPSIYYIEETRTLYKTIAEECGLDFVLDYYEENGACRFMFSK